MIERAHDAQGVENAGRNIDVVQGAGATRYSQLVRVVRHDAGRSVRDDVESFSLLIRTDLAERRARQEYELRIHRGERLVVDAELRRHARDEVLDDHIYPWDEFVDDLTPFGSAQIDGEALFAPIECKRHSRVAAIALTIPEPPLFGAVGWFDFDHARTEVRQQETAVRAGDVLRELEDGDPLQNRFHPGILVRPTPRLLEEKLGWAEDRQLVKMER